jgi:hypothetical protein
METHSGASQPSVPRGWAKGKAIWIAAGALVLLGGGVLAYRNNTGVQETVNGALARVSPVTPKVELPVGTEFAIRLETTLTTKSSLVGDRFLAEVAEPVMRGGETVVPAGATISGRVISVAQPGKASGRGHLQLGFDRLEFGGHAYELDTKSRVYESASGTKKDAAMIGGGAVGGAVIGGLVGGSAGDAAKGAVIGGAAGTGAALMTRGPQLEMKAGTVITFRTDRVLYVVPAETA